MPMLTLEQDAQAELVRLTRATLVATVRRRSESIHHDVECLCQRVPELAQPGGAFVTIYVEQLLRGCLGEIESTDPVLEVVLRCARRVPLYDNRFDRVQPAELPALTFKVSLLSALQPLEAPEQVKLGLDGLLVRHEGQCGLLLPEVPVEYGWDVTTFLTHLWRKAGIPAKVPVSDVQLWKFNTLIISSEDFPGVAPAGLD